MRCARFQHPVVGGIVGIAALVAGSLAVAQVVSPGAAASEMTFQSSWDHYDYLYNLHEGGTKHSYESVPKWEGLWTPAGNTIAGFRPPTAFLSESGEIVEDTLTLPYEAHYETIRSEVEQHGQILYDRLADCQPPGYPRFLMEPDVREFVNTPTQSWQLNDLNNEIRRIYVDKEHKNLEGTYSWLGDTVGFWAGDKLITHTVHVLPGDYFRAQPLTSNEFESIEEWTHHELEDGKERIEVRVTFYDELALTKPISGVYTYERARDLEEAGFRIRTWECVTSNNAYLSEDGYTNFRLPGDEGYQDPRGFSAYPDLPGQSRDPIYNRSLPTRESIQ